MRPLSCPRWRGNRRRETAARRRGGARACSTRSTRAHSRLRRGRRGRPARDHRAARPSRVARCQRPLAQPDLPVAQRGLGLRRGGLPRRASRVRHARGPRRLVAEAGGAASACCSTWSPTTPATATRGSRSRASAVTRRTATGTSGPTRPGGGPPNNWLSVFGGPAWTLDEATRPVLPAQLPAQQPDLNWWNEERARRSSTTSCASGSRAGSPASASTWRTAIVKDRELRDNPPADRRRQPRRAHDRPAARLLAEPARGARRAAPLARARRRPEEPPRVLVGETWALDLERLCPSTAAGDELHLAFNFFFVEERVRGGGAARDRRGRTRRPAAGGWPVWTLSNHDLGRFPTRWARDDPRARCALRCCCSRLRGTPVLYYGDELGMPDTPVDRDRRCSTPCRAHGRTSAPRPSRTPMQWSAGPGAGFTERAPSRGCRSATTRRSTSPPAPGPRLAAAPLRDLIALRREREDLRAGAYARCRRPPAPGPAGAASASRWR